MDSDVWSCPVCWSEVSEARAGLVCGRGHSFRKTHGIDVLVRPEQEAILAEAESFAAVWKTSRWHVAADLIQRLPYVGGSGWKQKAASLRALLDILGPAQERKVVDVGAGTGWLSHRLAEAGFRSYAMDVSWDPEVGLGAASAFDRTPHAFQRAIATLDRWPLLSASVDVAICNASLHYVADIDAVLAQAGRVLRPNGLFIELNSPVHKDARSAARAARSFRDRLVGASGSTPLLLGHGHFVQSELERSLRQAFTSVRRHDPAYGLGFRTVRALKGLVLRTELASFPIYVAQAR